jgi:hypothetical protein
MIAAKVSKRELRRFMSARGLTGFEVARILGIAPQTVYCYMCGVRSMTRRQLQTVKDALQHLRTLPDSVQPPPAA